MERRSWASQVAVRHKLRRGVLAQHPQAVIRASKGKEVVATCCIRTACQDIDRSLTLHNCRLVKLEAV